MTKNFHYINEKIRIIFNILLIVYELLSCLLVLKRNNTETS